MKSFQLTSLALARASAREVFLPVAASTSGVAAGRVSLGPDQPRTATPFYYFSPRVTVAALHRSPAGKHSPRPGKHSPAARRATSGHFESL